MPWLGGKRALDVDDALLGGLDCPGDGVPLRVLLDDGGGEGNVGHAVSGRLGDLWLCYGGLLRILEIILLWRRGRR